MSGSAALAKNLDLVLKGRDPVVYKTDGAPMMGISLGRSRATGRFGNMKLPSIMVWFASRLSHIFLYLASFPYPSSTALPPLSQLSTPMLMNEQRDAIWGFRIYQNTPVVLLSKCSATFSVQLHVETRDWMIFHFSVDILGYTQAKAFNH